MGPPIKHPDDLFAWAAWNRYMFQGDEVALLDMLPAIWAGFSTTSRTCLALHVALEVLTTEDEKVRAWVLGCREGLEGYRVKRARSA